MFFFLNFFCLCIYNQVKKYATISRYYAAWNEHRRADIFQTKKAQSTTSIAIQYCLSRLKAADWPTFLIDIISTIIINLEISKYPFDTVKQNWFSFYCIPLYLFILSYFFSSLCLCVEIIQIIEIISYPFI